MLRLLAAVFSFWWSGVTVATATLAPQAIEIPAHPLDRAGAGPLTLPALIRIPSGAGPHPAIVLLHGCGGIHDAKGRMRSRDRDWAERFAAAGHTVLQVDSFTPRGARSICAEREPRRIRVSVERARDSYAALLFLQARADIRPEAIALLGWSNGGTTTLWALADDSRARPAMLVHDYAVGIAFYPGCRALGQTRVRWRPVAPVLLLIGDADDWTPAPPCADLAARNERRVAFRLYPGAFHDFDAPDMVPRKIQLPGVNAAGSVTAGTDPRAREAALREVPDFLARHLPARRPDDVANDAEAIQALPFGENPALNRTGPSRQEQNP
jgi:dienelactone hydrolase